MTLRGSLNPVHGLARHLRKLRAAEIMLRAEPPLLEDALSHAQQAAEKAFKGLLAWHDQPFRKTHSLEEIGEQCLRIAPNLKGLVDRAVPLTEYAWRFRYPSETEEPTRGEAEDALATAREVCEAVLLLLPEEVRP